MAHDLERRLVLLGMGAMVVGSCVQSPRSESPFAPFLRNHSPAVDSLVAYPDTIGPSDSTIVVCYARDPDGDDLRFDWLTDARLRIPGQPGFADTYLNNQVSPRLTFYNRDLGNPINDSAWVSCDVRDTLGGGSGRRIFVILRPAPSPR